MLAEMLGLTQPDISKVERYERRVDILELLDMIHVISNGDNVLKENIWKFIDECHSESR